MGTGELTAKNAKYAKKEFHHEGTKGTKEELPLQGAMGARKIIR